MGHLLPIEHEPDHAHDEEHQWRQGQGGVVGQRGGQPEAVVLPPVLDRTEDHVPERRDRHSFPLLPKVTRIERASGIIAAIGPTGKAAAGAAAAIVQVARGATCTCVRRESHSLSHCRQHAPYQGTGLGPLPAGTGAPPQRAVGDPGTLPLPDGEDVQYSLYKHGVSVHNDWEGAARTQATLGRRPWKRHTVL